MNAHCFTGKISTEGALSSSSFVPLASKTEEGDSDDEPPEEHKMVKVKRVHEQDLEESGQSWSLSKAARVFSDLGYTFRPDANERSDKTPSVRAASIHYR